MVRPNKKTLGRGAAYIYIELSIAALSGYLLWIFLTKIATPDTIGVASTAISLASMFTAITSLGLPNSITRHVGKSISDEKLADALLYLKSSLLLAFFSIFSCSVLILLLKDHWVLKNLDISLIILSIVLMGSSTIASILRHTIIASFRSKTLVSRQISASIIKVGLSVFLILIGTGGLGLVIGHAAGEIVAIAVMTLVLVKIFKKQIGERRITLKESCRSLFVGGIPSWIPASITLVGAQLGTVVVFGSSGASQAGTYFISFSILSAVTMIGNSLLSSAFPVLSSLSDGRKRLTWRITKISLIITIPISFSFLFYSEDILGLLGSDYTRSSPALQVLLTSVFPILVTLGVSTLVYSYGNYRQVLTIGLAYSIPRTVLYFILVPTYGGTGAAISFAVGSIIGFISSIVVAKQVGFNILWKDLCLILAIPGLLAFILSYLDIPYFLGLVTTMACSYILLLVLRILTKHDIEDSVSILPPRVSKPTINLLNFVGKKLRR